MKIIDQNVLYRDHILLIVYSYILVRSILSQAIISARIHRKSRENMRTAMAEPRTSLHQNGSINLSFILVNISAATVLFSSLKHERVKHKEEKLTVLSTGGGGE
jgi:hypothetical protein